MNAVPVIHRRMMTDQKPPTRVPDERPIGEYQIERTADWTDLDERFALTLSPVDFWFAQYAWFRP